MHFAVADKDNEAGGSSLEEVFVMGQSLAERHLWGHLDKILVTILKIHHDGGWSVPELKVGIFKIQIDIFWTPKGAQGVAKFVFKVLTQIFMMLSQFSLLALTHT